MVPSFVLMEQGPWVAPVQEVVQEVALRRDLVARLAEVGRHLVEIRGAQVDPQVVVDLDQLQAAHLIVQVLAPPAAVLQDHEVSQAEMFDHHGNLVNQVLQLQNLDLLWIQSLKKTAKARNLRINYANCL